MQNKSHVNKGLIIAAVLICFNAITHFTKTDFDEWTKLVFAAIIIIGLIVSIIFYNKELNNNTTFVTLFSYGFKTAAVVACVYFIYNLLAIYFFFPHFIEDSLNREIIELRKNNKFDEKGLQENMDKAKTVARSMYFALTLMGTLFLGIIGSLIGAVAAPKNQQQVN